MTRNAWQCSFDVLRLGDNFERLKTLELWKSALYSFREISKKRIHLPRAFRIAVVIGTAVLALSCMQVSWIGGIDTSVSTMSRDINFLQLPTAHIPEFFHFSDQEIDEQLEKELPNVPVKFWKSVNVSEMNKNSTCAQLPNILDLAHENIVWQKLETSKVTFHFYSAHYDIRAMSQNATIRILGLLNKRHPKTHVFCQIWLPKSKKPVIVPVFELRDIAGDDAGDDRDFYPYSVDCIVPRTNEHDNEILPPVAVSIVENPCDTARNLIKVNYNPLERGKKPTIAVCMMRVHFIKEDPTFKLIEQLELVRLLGAEKVFIYTLDTQSNPNLQRVFRYYQAQGFLEVSKLTIPGDHPNTPILHHEFVYERTTIRWMLDRIPANDCLFKSFYRHDLLAMIDLDEVIVPENGLTWRPMVKEATKGHAYSQLSFRYAYYPTNFPKSPADDWNKPELPEYLTKLNTVHRLPFAKRWPNTVKGFYNASVALSCNLHLVYTCLDESPCSMLQVPTEIASCHHYRAVSQLQMKYHQHDPKNKTTIRDLSLWSFKDQLLSAVAKAISELDLS